MINPPPFKRRRLGHRLRDMRLQAGLTLEAAAPRLDMSRTSLNRIETGQYRASVHLIRSMMDLYDCYVEDLLDQARDAVQPRWFQQYSLIDVGYVDVETEAIRVHQFCGRNLPGLLQTEPYARTVLASDPLPRSQKAFQEQVTVRMLRQSRLTDEENPLELVAIVDEAALHRRVGGADLMRAQLEHLIEATALPTVTLQVLAAEADTHTAVYGGFNLLASPEDYNPQLLYVEHVAGSLHIEEIEAVRVARLVFDRLRTEALNPADSVALIRKVSAGLEGR